MTWRSRPAALMRKLGCDLELVDRERMLAIEPALRFTNANIVGGSMTYADELGDACVFTRKLADKAQSAGVDFRFDTTVAGHRNDVRPNVRRAGAHAQRQLSPGRPPTPMWLRSAATAPGG